MTPDFDTLYAVWRALVLEGTDTPERKLQLANVELLLLWSL